MGPNRGCPDSDPQAPSGLPGGGAPLSWGVSEEQARSSVLLPQENPGSGAQAAFLVWEEPWGAVASASMGIWDGVNATFTWRLKEFSDTQMLRKTE